MLLAGNLMLVAGCGSGETDSTASPGDVSAPEVNRILDIPSLVRVAAATLPESNNLLTNGSFEDDLDGWGACEDQPKLKITDNSSDGSKAVLVKRGNCVQQGVAVSPGQSLNLSCDALMVSNNNAWTGLGLSFYDQDWNFISEPDAQLITSSGFSTYNIAATAPSSAANVAMWLYTDGQASLDNCVLSGDSTPPPPPLTGNLLYNASFVEQNGNMPDGWTDLCNGTSYSNFAFGDKSLTVADGACVHQYLRPQVLSAIQGKNFIYSCKYSSSSDEYATLATNLTSTRDNTGNNDVVVLPRTDYEGRVPVIKTVRLFGRAKDYLEPNDIFVAISGEASLFVTECALEVDTVNRQNYTRTFTLSNSTSAVFLNGIGVDGSWSGSYRGFGRDNFLIDGTPPSNENRPGTFYIKRYRDSLFLYVTTPIQPTVIDSYPENGQLWNDDSFELYFNLGNESDSGYDENDYTKVFAWNAGEPYAAGAPTIVDPISFTGANSQKQLTHSAKCNLLEEFGNAECELEFDLNEMGLADLVNPEFGFDIHWNIDEDGGDRDSKWSWCSNDTLTAWEDMSKVTCSFILDDALGN